MEKLSGKTIIFTDLHCGLGGNKQTRLNICIKVIKEILAAVKENDVKNIIFGGDWFHNRSTLDLNTINVSLKLIQALSKKCKCCMVVGNHDAYLKNSTDINSLNIFRDTPNIIVFDKADEIELNGQKCLLVPWLTDLSTYSPNTFDLAIGHFEISSKYLIQSYVEEHSGKNTVSVKTAAEIDSDDLLADGSSSKASSLIGNFVDLVKENHYIYAGHIHTHKEFKAMRRNFVFVGSPYEQNLGDINDPRGYYLLDESNAPKFVPIVNVPKHVKILMSEAVREGYDFSAVTGNIIQKVYDVDVQQKDEASVVQKILDFKPYEGLIPDYQVKMDFSMNGGSDNSSLDLIRKSKVDYMKNYVENIEQAALDSQNLDRDKLFSVLEEYYKKVTEG